MGYSRGAAVANLFGGELVNEPDCIGVTVAPENIYDYSFGTPQGVLTSDDPGNAKYGCIHNVYADYDPVTMAAFKQWGFTRYVTDKLLPVHNAAAKSKMLQFLAKTNPTLYKAYVTKGSGQDPDYFYPMKFVAGDGLKIDADTSADTKVARTQKDLRGEISVHGSGPDRLLPAAVGSGI